MEIALQRYRDVYLNTDVEVISHGNGFGAVEHARSGGDIPKGFNFTTAPITDAERPWVELIKTGQMRDDIACELPLSYMVDLRYEAMLIAAAKSGSFTAYNHLGVMYEENSMSHKAWKAFESSNKIVENPFAYRNLYILAKNNDDKNAIEIYHKAIELLGDNLTREYAEEYIVALCDHGQYALLLLLIAYDYSAKLISHVNQTCFPRGNKERKIIFITIFYYSLRDGFYIRPYIHN